VGKKVREVLKRVKKKHVTKQAKGPRTKFLAREPYELGDGITQSLLSSFLTCRRRTEWELEGWRPVGTKQAIWFGSLFHSLLENLCIQIRAGGIGPQDADDFFEEFIEPWIKKHTKRASFDSPKTAHFLAAQAKAVFAPYCEYWEEDFNRTWLETEGVFDTVVDMGLHDYRLRGRRDGIEELKKNRLRLVEHKTKGQIPEKLSDVLLFDFQNLFYLLTLNVDLTTMFGKKYKPVVDVLYNIIRRPGIKLKNGENLKHYTERIREAVTKDSASLAHYFKRNELIYPLKDQALFRDELKFQLTEFRMWRAGTMHTFRGPSSMCMPGWTCQFIDACAYQTMDGYQQNGILFEELMD